MPKQAAGLLILMAGYHRNMAFTSLLAAAVVGCDKDPALIAAEYYFFLSPGMSHVRLNVVRYMGHL